MKLGSFEIVKLGTNPQLLNLSSSQLRMWSSLIGNGILLTHTPGDAGGYGRFTLQVKKQIQKKLWANSDFDLKNYLVIYIMKRVGNLINKIADTDNIRLAFWKAAKGKRANVAANLFQQNLESNVLLLSNQILTGKVNIGHYTFFRIYEPKERVICAASFQERVLHHAIINICEPIFEKYAIFDSYACRVGKGSHKAVLKAKSLEGKYKYYLKLDIKKFFDSIDHKILYLLLERRIKDKKLLDIYQKIINSYNKSPGKGLPIGNLLSQHWANFYLGYFDHWIKENKSRKGYLRYMDDFVLLSNNKSDLKNLLKEIESFLCQNLNLELKNNIQLNYCEKGIPFLGYRIFPGSIKLAPKSKKRLIKKLKLYEWKFKRGFWSELTLQKHIQPLFEFVKFADSLRLRNNIIEKYGCLS